MSVTDVRERRRIAVPQAQPQALAWDGRSLWLSSRVTHDVFRFNPENGAIEETYRAPGVVYGLTYGGTAFRAICSEGPDDDRYVRTFAPQKGFGERDFPCPELTGSYLAWDRSELFMTQWYRKRIFALGEDGRVRREFPAPRELCGCAFVGADLYLITTDDEETDEFFLMRCRFAGGGAQFEDVARVPFKARSLAWDGATFWSNHRAQGELVAFEA